MKRCASCAKLKDERQFYTNGHRTRDGGNVLQSKCKVCSRAWQRKYRAIHRDAIRERKRLAYQRSRSSHRDGKLRRLYGLTQRQYAQLAARQLNVCAICGLAERTRANNGRELKSLSVDHDHTNGQVRGLLCAQCNKGLGNFGESADRLRAAAQYLERSTTRREP
jgi:hypothetical protein